MVTRTHTFPRLTSVKQGFSIFLNENNFLKCYASTLSMEEFVGCRPALTQASASDRMPPWPCLPHQHLCIAPPLFVDNIRWWDNFFLQFLRPSTPNKLHVDPNHLAPLKTHGSDFSLLVPSSKIFFVCKGVLGIFPASNNKTLQLSLFFHPHSINFHHFHLLNEDHDKQNGNDGSILQEPLSQYWEQLHDKLRQTKVCIEYCWGMKHCCQQEGQQYYLQLQPCRTAVHEDSWNV